MLEHNDRIFKSTLKKIRQDITMKFMGEHKVVLKTTRNEWVFFSNWSMNVNFISIMQCTSGLDIIGVLYMQCVLHFIFGSIWASGVLYMRFPFMQGAKDAYDHYFVAIKLSNWPKEEKIKKKKQ